MQEVLGEFYTDRNGVAQLSSVAMVTHQRLHSSPRKPFTPQIQMTVRRVDAQGGRAFARDRHDRAKRRQTGVAGDCGRQDMMFDCLCVCHSGFQNEVIGG
ncbi:hypothetical protein [Sulfuritalea hydrogenivorans]|uniref:Uncharacterized protein n=1 Tax=Sulfuritalea hydrogenivorans sk43H TaxID=1223802 RepID=W0SIP9_9PROT|nr:hypothetical protein [Sulfuritalea hydrogenivorans]BAO30782.1 hypothetical protein SUTH_03003 [Sulfuritalea hydrogenivorans sk43H]